MTNIFDAVDNEQQEIEREADDIAANITRILVDAFKAKENRDPTPDELDQLLSELTEERIAEMLGETFVPRENASDDEGSEEEDEGDDDVEDVEVPVAEEKHAVVEEPTPSPPLEPENSNINLDVDESAAKRRKLGGESSEPSVVPEVI